MISLQRFKELEAILCVGGVKSISIGDQHQLMSTIHELREILTDCQEDNIKLQAENEKLKEDFKLQRDSYEDAGRESLLRIEDLLDSNEKLRGLLVAVDSYLDIGTTDTAIFQSSGFHQDIKEALQEKPDGK